MSIYSAFYDFLNKNVYTFKISEERGVWFYKNLDILRNLLKGREGFEDCYGFLNKVENRTCTDDIYNLFSEKKDYIINAVKPIAALTKKAIKFRRKYGVSAEKEIKNISQMIVGDSKKEPNFICFNGYVCQLWEKADYDWHYYAKSYGHPKKTVEKREIYFTKKKGVCDSVELKSFRYKDIIEGFAKFFEIPIAPKNKLQTNPYFEVKKVKETSKYSVFTQNFGDKIVGYVVSDGKITYHDDTKIAALEGWKKKAALDKEKKDIKAGKRFTAAQLHEKYGFCWAGMREFADTCGLDIEKSYTKKELRTAFNQSPDRRRLMIKYKTELSKVL